MIKQTNKFYLLMFLPILFLVGCETVPEQEPTSVEWQAHQSKLTELTHYQISGKLGYIDNAQRQSLNFVWDHSPEQTTIRLNTFFGKNVLTLTMFENKAKLEMSTGEIYFDKDADSLIANLTGMKIPVSDMKYWIKGEPRNVSRFEVNELNSLKHLEKDNSLSSWQLNYDKYKNYSDYLLPRSLKLTQHSNVDDQNVKLNVSITNWKIK